MSEGGSARTRTVEQRYLASKIGDGNRRWRGQRHEVARGRVNSLRLHESSEQKLEEYQAEGAEILGNETCRKMK